MLWFLIGVVGGFWLTSGLLTRYALPDHQKERAEWEGWFTHLLADHIGVLVFWPFAISYCETNPITKWKVNHGSNREAEADRGDPQDSPSDADAGEDAEEGAGEDPQPLIAPPGFEVWIGAAEELVPVEQDTMPVLAHRWAHLRRHSHGIWKFFALNASHGALEIDADAVCRRGYDPFAQIQQSLRVARSSFSTAASFSTTPMPEARLTSVHAAPDLNCACGFYAVPADMLGHHSQDGAIELEVQLSGRVIECETGYRAEHQTILGWKPRRCHYCETQATRNILVTIPDGEDNRPTNWDIWLCSGCKPGIHGPAMTMEYTVEEISESLGVGVKT